MNRDFFIAELEACSSMLYRVAWSILRSDADVQDALQDAALKAWDKREQLREDRLFRTWITRILIFACYDAQKRQRRMIPMERLPETDMSTIPDPTLSLALDTLPEKLRLPLVLCYSEGLTYEEAAEVLHIPVTTLRGRLRRGKDQLRKELDAE